MWVMYPACGLSMGGKRIRTEIGMSEALKKFGSPSLGNPGRAIDDKVLVKAYGVTCLCFD